MALKIYFLLLTILLTSCEIINPEEEIPAYIRINGITLKDNPNLNEGVLSSNFSDAWIYIDDQTLGAFEMPTCPPALYKGTHKITVCPGIKLNGIAATRAIYTKCNCFETYADFKENQDIIINPEVRYHNSVNFLFNEDFESAGTIFQKKTETSDTSLMTLPANNTALNQNSYGAVFFDEKRTKFEVFTNKNYTLPKNGTSVFLELDYYCNNEFIVGLYINSANQSTQHPVLIVKPVEGWRKIYVNLTPTVSTQTSAIDYKIFIGAQKDSTLSNPFIYLDNIKLLY